MEVIVTRYFFELKFDNTFEFINQQSGQINCYYDEDIFILRDSNFINDIFKFVRCWYQEYDTNDNELIMTNELNMLLNKYRNENLLFLKEEYHNSNNDFIVLTKYEYFEYIKNYIRREGK